MGLIDWDYLHPGAAVDDLAYALFWFAPMRPDEHCLDWHHFPVVPDRRARIRQFLSAYGPTPSFDAPDVVVRRGQATIDLELALAAQGAEPQRSWVADGVVEEEAAELRPVADNRDVLTLESRTSGLRAGPSPRRRPRRRALGERRRQHGMLRAGPPAVDPLEEALGGEPPERGERLRHQVRPIERRPLSRVPS